MTQRIKTFAILTAPGGLLALFLLLRRPSEADSAIFLGLSIQRLALVFAALVLTLALLFLAWKAEKVSAWVERHSRKLDALFGLLFGIGWLAVWTPSYQLGALSGYFERAYPLLAWTLWLAAVAIALRVAERGLQWAALKAQWREHPALWRGAAVTLGVFLLLWGWIAVTGIGLKRDIDMWNEAGVPVLGLQVLFGLGLAGLVLFWERRLNGQQAHRRFDAGIFVLIWLTAAIVWQQEPLLRSYFLPRPTPPNFEYYPFSDAALYDFGGQQVLLGNGIFNGLFTDKPMYMLLLALFHAIAGQSYERVILVQVLFIAFYPAMLFLIGKCLHSRAAGVMMAILAIFKEKNAIAAVLDIQVTHSKLMMSEMPTALMLSVFTLLGVLWFKRKGNFSLPLWAGGLLGIATLVRPTPALIAPFIIAFALFLYGRSQMKSWFFASAVFGLGLMLVMGPWFGFTQSATGENYLLEKIQRVFERFKLTLPESESYLGPRYDASMTVVKPDLMPLPPQLEPAIAAQNDNPGMGYLVLSHFWHNEVTSVIILPSTFRFHNLKYMVAQPPWQLGWEGEISPETGFFVLLNLSLLALGIGAAWARARWAGILPLLVHFSYNLANAFGRTSGSRYIVAVDWVLFIYYSLGVLQLLSWARIVLGRPSLFDEGGRLELVESRTGSRSFLVASMILLAIGLSLPFNSWVIPQRFEQQSTKEILRDLEADGLEELLRDKGVRLANVKNLVNKDKRAIFLHGLAFFPRYYGEQDAGCDKCFMMDYAYVKKEFPRLAFTVIGMDNGSIYMPLSDAPAYFPNPVEVFVFGCKRGARKTLDISIVEGLFVIVVGENGNILYLKEPLKLPLNCKK